MGTLPQIVDPAHRLAGSPIAGEGNTSIRLFPCSTMTNLLAIASSSKAGDEARITHYVRRAWTLVIEAPHTSMLFRQHVARGSCWWFVFGSGCFVGRATRGAPFFLLFCFFLQKFQSLRAYGRVPPRKFSDPHPPLIGSVSWVLRQQTKAGRMRQRERTQWNAEEPETNRGMRDCPSLQGLEQPPLIQSRLRLHSFLPLLLPRTLQE
jgi:hypothetical protein